MGKLLDEFDFLIEEEIETTFEEDSEQLVKEVINFKEKSLLYPKATYQGISVENLCKCIDFGETDIAPWEHTYFTIDLGILKDITNGRIEELYIPTFIEELRSSGDTTDTEFGYNQRFRNYIKSVKIPKNVIIISPNTFSFYNKLENIKFEKESKLIFLGERTFAFCEKLLTVDLRNCELLDKLPSNLLFESSVKVLKISSKIKELSDGLFNQCNLQEIIVDDESYSLDEFKYKLALNNNKPFWSEKIDPYNF